MIIDSAQRYTANKAGVDQIRNSVNGSICDDKEIECFDQKTFMPLDSVDHDIPCYESGEDYECNCAKGYRHIKDPHICEDIDECLDPVSRDPEVSVCLNEPGAYSCQCNWGFFQVDKITCKDIDECKSGVNGNSGIQACPPIVSKCSNSYGSYSCICNDGYEFVSSEEKLKVGCQDCCEDIDECARNISLCQDECVDGLKPPPPVKYTCGCFKKRFPVNGLNCEDCLYEDWGDWSSCNVTCGEGYSSRKRNPSADHGEGEEECERSEYKYQLVKCVRPPCEKAECQLSPWSVWSDCNVTSGNGYENATRHIVSNGDACPENTTFIQYKSCFVTPESFDWMSHLNYISISVAGGCLLAVITGGGYMTRYCVDRLFRYDEAL